ncbi:MAG: CYTH and CHAD domain-containing protein [Nitrospira sp.]
MTQSDRHRSHVVSSMVERELKLSVDSKFRLPPLAGTPLPRRMLISTYYDTASYDLAHARITLRYRVERGKQAWQLKVPLGQDRLEIELVERQTSPPAILRDLLMLAAGERELTPVATLRVWRTGVRVRHGRLALADVVLDRVSVVKEGRVVQQFRELEIERLQGDEGSLRAIEHQLRQACACDHDGRPKLFHALSLPAPAPDAPPAPDMPVIEHLKWALARHVRWLVAHDPGTRVGIEPESLHQMRVATRRLRAMLRAARPLLVSDWAIALQHELHWLSELLGPARDLDVQIAYLTNAVAGLEARDRKPLMQFVAALHAQREQLQPVLVNELKTARYVDLMRRLHQTSEAPAVVESPLTLHDLAQQEFKKLRKTMRQLAAAPSNAAIHRLRIKVKRTRYTAELAEHSSGKAVTTFIKRARALQDLLGTHQDAVQMESYLREFAHRATSVRAGFAAGRIVERQHAYRAIALKQLPKLWRRLLKQGKKIWD